MKKIIAALIVVMIVETACVHESALVGKATLSYFLVNPRQTLPNGIVTGVRTDIHVINLLADPQNITVTLYNMDGSPLANYPVDLYNGSTTLSTASTNSEGSVVAEVRGKTQLAVSIGSDGFVRAGYGTIMGSVKAPSNRLIADAQVRGILLDGTSYSISVPINGGMPF